MRDAVTPRPSEPRNSKLVGTVAVATVLGMASAVLAAPLAASAAVSPSAAIVISEVYGGGGNSGATLKQDFIELYNKSAAPVDLAGWSVQYASAAGTAWAVTPLTSPAGVVLQPGQHLLIGEASGAGGTVDLTPDLAGTIAMSGTSAKVALVNTVTPLSGAIGNASLPQVIDFVGWGTAGEFAGTGAAPATTNATSIARDANKTNTANNAADFTTGTPTPTARGTVDPEPEPDPEFHSISEIQGTSAESPFAGDPVITRGVVTATYPTGGYNGYVIQTEGTGGELDASHTASDAIFVYSPATAATTPLGAFVEVTGLVSEYRNSATDRRAVTQITVASEAARVVLSDPFTAPLPVTTSWPATDDGREVLESMLIAVTGPFTVTNTFSTNQYGEVGLAAGTTPLRQPTDVAEAGSPEAIALAADNFARGVVLDDGASTNYLNPANQSLTPPWISLTEPVRVGAEAFIADTLIVDWRNNTWKLQPTAPLSAADPEAYPATFENTRTAAPETVGGDLSVASFNVLNYFTTLGAQGPSCVAFVDRLGDGVTVEEGCDQRGAWDPEDLARQQVKIVEAINTLDASVVGLLEIENSAKLGGQADEALATLVNALNADAGEAKWAYVASPSNLPDLSLVDVITNAIIYQPALATPLGASTALGTQSAAGQPFANAREPIAQAFSPADGGEDFVVVVNHFKSKGSSGATGVEVDSGQGAWNASRVAQATALRDWVATDPTGAGTDSVLLVGDFNAYGQEDPLRVLYGAGYVDAEHTFGLDESSYSFSGLSGSLDHVLLSSAAAARATGADIWTINSPESLALEYSRYNYHGTLFYAPDPFRSSDHDPVKVGLDAGLEASATTLALAKTEVVYGAKGTVTATATVTSDADATGSVEFVVDGAVIATAPLTNGVATAKLALPGTLASGPHAVIARYTGSPDVAASESAPVALTVRAAASRTDLIAVLPVHVNRVLPSTLVAWVTLETGKAPAGVVEFREGTTVVATVPVVRGSAAFQLPSTLTRGIHEYTATFVPADPANIVGSVSGDVDVRVVR